jgi:hypothetical protein
MSEVTTGLMLLSNIRFSHFYGHEPYIGKPSAQIPNPKPVFKSDLLLAPTHADLARVAAKIDEVGRNHQWKGGLTWEQAKEVIRANNALCLKRGEIAGPGDAAYAGMFVVKASNKNRFTIIDGLRNPLTAKDGKPYSGSWGNATIDIWAQDNEWGRRINATITGAQFLRDDAAFGGGARAASPDEFPVHNPQSADAPAPGGAVDPLAGLGV